MIGRPPKNKKLLKNVPLRIMLTADQRRQIEQAAKAAQLETSTWARQIILAAAQGYAKDKE